MQFTCGRPAVLSLGTKSAECGCLPIGGSRSPAGDSTTRKKRAPSHIKPPEALQNCVGHSGDHHSLSNAFMSDGNSRRELTTTSRDDQLAEFLELYSTNYLRLQYYVTALLPTANDASDVLQETSMVLWRKFDTFELGTNFFAWACKIARLQVMKFRERQHRSAHLLDNEVIEKLASEAADENNLPSVTLQALENCLGRLSAIDQSLIRRRYQPGMTVRQLAKDIGRTANSLTKSLGRIRRALLECVGRTLAREARE
jgi:RNA polymerase sigma-70 factor, ECF subfamily